MKQRLTLILLIMLLSGATLSLALQHEDPPVPVDEVPSQQAPAEQAQDPEGISPVSKAEPDADSRPDAKSASENADNTPFEYQSTEKISEDLSVSFPVDI